MVVGGQRAARGAGVVGRVHALDVVGPKRLLFGSDSSYFPRGWHQQIFEDQSKALYELGVSLADARAIFSENLLRIMAA